MAHAGQNRRHRRDDKPEKFPTPQRNAAAMMPLQDTPQANAERPDHPPPDPEGGENLITKQTTKVGPLAGTSHDKDSD